jgi:hypothetical protein
MENENQIQAGTWDKMTTENYDNVEKIKFEVNIAQKVVVLNPVPKELSSDNGGVYYVFDVEQDGKKSIIQTSAWTLLRELKKAELKAGMILEITKKLEKGKQFFQVKVL